MITALASAERGIIENHKRYGEVFRLVKYIPNATGGIYRQSKKIYESVPYEIVGCITRVPTGDILSPIGESSQNVAEVTVPVRFVEDIFGGSTKLLDTITTKDLIIFDERVWRITQSSLSARIGDRPLLFVLELREKLGEKHKEYL